MAPVDESGAAVYLWGRRASGFAFAPGAALSAVIYDKALEETAQWQALDGSDPYRWRMACGDAIVPCRGTLHA